MSHIVNFLPWRETRRRQRLRMAGLLIVGLLLILLVAILASRLNKRASHSLETARISADDLLYSALQQRERAMRQRLQQQEQRRLRYLRRERTAAWQPTLQAIASRMPEHAWLTLLEYRQNTLVLPQVQAQWRKLLPLRSALQTAGMEEDATQVFTPIDLPIAGATLIAWRPGGSAGEMQLAVDWQAVPALFSWLARCGMRATAFSLQPEKQALRLTLHLEAEDAP